MALPHIVASALITMSDVKDAELGMGDDEHVRAGDEERRGPVWSDLWRPRRVCERLGWGCAGLVDI